MKKLLFSICAFGLFTTAMAQTVDRSIKPKPGPAPVINIGDAKTFTLDNGLKVFVVENHKLPRVSYSIILDIDAPSDGKKAGVKDVIGELITSGTATRTKDEFDIQVDAIGGNISASSEAIYGSSLVKHQEKLLELMSDCLLNASFKQAELDKLKKQMASNLATSTNNPEAMLSNISRVLVYGQNHPYAEITTEETMAAVNLTDVTKYFRTYFRPNTAYMAIVGDITVDEAKKLVTKYFDKWQKAEVPKVKYPKVPVIEETTVNFANRNGSVQSVIGIDYPAEIKVGTTDAINARVLNSILGGSSQGRLFLNLRETKGWTYGSYSTMSPDPEIGKVSLFVKCRNEVTDSAIVEMLGEMNRIRTAPVTDAELQGAINYINGSFAIGLQSPQTIAQYAINTERYNLPKDYYKNYIKNISAVTAADLQATAQKYVLPENANIIVVGNKTEVEKLKKFSKKGEINFFDNYGNSAAPIENKSINNVTVQNVLDNYVNAIGGTEAVSAITSLSSTGETKFYGRPYSISETISGSDKYANVLKPIIETRTKTSIDSDPTSSMNGKDNIKNFEIKEVINGDKGYFSQMGQRKEYTPEEIEDKIATFNFDAIINPEKFGISYTLMSIQNVDGKDMYLVEKASNNGKKITEQYYDITTGLLSKEIETTKQGGRENIAIKMYSDYKPVKGSKMLKPHTVKVTGSMSYDVKFNSIKANEKIKESVFK